MSTVSCFAFQALAEKAVPAISREESQSVYEAIGRGSHTAWKSLTAAMGCFERKCKLDSDMASLRVVIDSHSKRKRERRGSRHKLNIFARSKSANTSQRELQSARIELSKLSIRRETGLLLRELERGFALGKGSLSIIPNDAVSTAGSAANKASMPYKRPSSSSKQRSHSVTPFTAGRRSKRAQSVVQRPSKPPSLSSSLRTKPLPPARRGKGAGGKAKPPSSKPRPGHGYSQSIATVSTADRDVVTVRRMPRYRADRRHLKEQADEAEAQRLIDTAKAKKRSMSCVPNIGTRQYLSFLLERALSNKAWNDNDAERLCAAAVAMDCDWITIHSMWVPHCAALIARYRDKKRSRAERAKKLQKSRVRRSSRMGAQIAEAVADEEDEDDDDDEEDEEELDGGNGQLAIVDEVEDRQHAVSVRVSKKSTTSICATIGYPLGSSSTASKVAEAEQAVRDGAQRIRLMISAGKVVIGDWPYIIAEIKAVVNAGSGADVRIVFPDTAQITAEMKQTFNEKIIRGMSRKGEDDHELDGDGHGDGDDEKQRESQRNAANKERIQKYIENEMSETDDDQEDGDEDEEEMVEPEPSPRKSRRRAPSKIDEEDEQEVDDAEDLRPSLRQSFTSPVSMTQKAANKGPGYGATTSTAKRSHGRNQSARFKKTGGHGQKAGAGKESTSARHRRRQSDRNARMQKFDATKSRPSASNSNLSVRKSNKQRSKSKGDIRYGASALKANPFKGQHGSVHSGSFKHSAKKATKQDIHCHHKRGASQSKHRRHRKHGAKSGKTHRRPPSAKKCRNKSMINL